MSDTPRTDAEAFRPCKGCVDDRLEVVTAEFARQLEREVNALKEMLPRPSWVLKSNKGRLRYEPEAYPFNCPKCGAHDFLLNESACRCGYVA